MTGKELKSLEQHNKERNPFQGGTPGTDGDFNANGIACPECSYELKDVSDAVLFSDPAKVHVGCDNCGWRGTRNV